MRVIINSQEQSNELVAMEYVKLLKDKPASVLGLATGSTPGFTPNSLSIIKTEQLALRMLKPSIWMNILDCHLSTNRAIDIL